MTEMEYIKKQLMLAQLALIEGWPYKQYQKAHDELASDFKGLADTKNT